MRLDVSFWLSCNKDWLDHQPAEGWEKYTEWRTEVERVMTREDLEYMLRITDKKEAREHYDALLKQKLGKSEASMQNRMEL